MNTYQLLSIMNLAVCICIAWACICRLNSAVCRQCLRARARYSLLLTGALASGFQPVLFREQPTLGTLLLSCAVLACLLINLGRWLSPCEAEHE